MEQPTVMLGEMEMSHRTYDEIVSDEAHLKRYRQMIVEAIEELNAHQNLQQ